MQTVVQIFSPPEKKRLLERRQCYRNHSSHDAQYVVCSCTLWKTL